MSALDPTADDAVPAATHRAVPRANVRDMDGVRTYCRAKVPTLQQFLAQHFDTVVRA